MRWLLVLLATTLVQCQSILKAREPAASRKILDKSGYLYDPTDRSCDGYPRLEVETMPGTCLGLVLPAEKTGFRMPRTILQVRGTTDFLLVDMGGWATRKGALYLLRKGNNGYEHKLLKSGLDKPHGLAYGADDFIYVGETHQISRFRLRAGAIEGWQVAVGDLPRFEGHMHPLTQFTFDERNGDLFVNSGAPSDHCFAKEKGTYVDCPETSEMGLGAIYRYPAAFLKDLSRGPARMREMAGQGLRNSMAMTVSPAGYLIQAENSRDFPQLEEPYEEINVIDLKNSGHHHGWPQCYNFHAVSPEWLYKENSQTGLRKRFQTLLDCGGTAVTSESYYQMPHALIPPHAAPLHMAYYGKSGQLAPLLGGKLIMSWHGYQPAGQRLVAYPVDAEGRPVLTAAKNATYGFNQKGACAVRKPFAPTGGLERVAPYEEVISGWDEIKGKRPKGAPVGFTVADDGSIWIVEDRNTRTVTRLARAPGAASAPAPCTPPSTDAVDPRIELLAWRRAVIEDQAALDGYRGVRDGLALKYCSQCHAGFKETDIADDEFSQLDYLVKNEWITAGASGKSKLYQAVAQTGDFPPMPPNGSPQFAGTPEGAALVKSVAAWIDRLPKTAAGSFVKIEMGSARKLRDKPGTVGKECGAVEAGAVIHVDPRAERRVTADGWLWTPAYVLPGDPRLFSGACKYPRDGVFYMALKKL